MKLSIRTIVIYCSLLFYGTCTGVQTCIDGAYPRLDSYVIPYDMLRQIFYTSLSDMVSCDSEVMDIVHYDWNRLAADETLQNAPFIVCVKEGRQGVVDLLNKVKMTSYEPLWTRARTSCYIVYTNPNEIVELIDSFPRLQYLMPYSGLYQLESTLIRFVASGKMLSDPEECESGIRFLLPHNDNTVDPQKLIERLYGELTSGEYKNLLESKFYLLSSNVENLEENNVRKTWRKAVQELVDGSQTCDFSNIRIHCSKETCLIQNVCDLSTDTHNSSNCILGVIAYLSTIESVVHIENVHKTLPVNINAARITQSQNSTQIGYKYWNAGLNGSGQIATVFDSGFTYDSCYFTNGDGIPPPFASPTNCTNRVTYNKSLRKIVQYIVGLNGGVPADRDGHGSHCAGSVAGYVAGTTPGVDTWNGMAPACQLQLAGFYKGSFFGPVDTFPCTRAVGSYVYSYSFKASGPYGEIGRTFDTYFYNYDNFTFFQAASNDGDFGKQTRSIPSGAQAKNSVTVGASMNRLPKYFAPNDNPNMTMVAYFSGIGPTDNGRIKPDVVAPGKDVNSVKYNTPCSEIYMQGTSMACPVAAGNGVLIRQYYVDGYYPTGILTPGNAMPNPSSALIKATLITSALAMQSYHRDYNVPQNNPWPLPPPPNIWAGHGLVSLSRVLRINNESYPVIYVKDRATLSEGQVHTYKFSVPSTSTINSPFQISLVWTDPPGAVGSAGAILNNLDISATLDSDAKKSKIIYPNNLLMPDTINNVEKIIIPNPTLGDVITIKVTGTDISVTASQKYAMVASGVYVPAAWYCQDPRSIRPNTLYTTANCRIPCQTHKKNPICCPADAGDFCTVGQANDSHCWGLTKPGAC